MSRSFCRPLYLITLVAAVCSAGHVFAQALPAPRLESVYPFSGQAGSTVEISVAGDAIEGTQQLLFSHSAIKAEPVMTEPDKFYPEARPVENRFKVTIPADVPAGAYEVRLANKLGVTNARRFVVGTLPEAFEVEPNNDEKTATEVGIDTVISGLCDQQQRDFYRFTAKKGQRLIIHCMAQRADSRADPTIALYDSASNVLERAHDAVRLDPMIDFTAPADGTYFISVNDFLYGGGEQLPYRLSISTGPWIEWIDPPFATPGAQSTHTVYGRNLPGGTPAPDVVVDGEPLEKLQVTIPIPADPAKVPPAVDTFMRPVDGSLDTLSYHVTSSSGIASNPVRLALVSGSLTPEKEPNDTPEQAQPLTIPAQVVARSSPRGDRDWVAFEAKQGEQYWLEMTAGRLDLPMDPVMLIQHVGQDKEGKTVIKDIAEVDDQLRLTLTLQDQRYRFTADDPGILFTAPQDGQYRVQLRDLYSGAQGGPQFFYLFTIRRSEPDFSLLAHVPRPDPANNTGLPGAITVRKGGSALIEVLGFRRDGFAGEITLTVEGLPPGLTAQPAVMGTFADYAAVVVQSTPEAANWVGPIQVVGKAKLGEKEAVRVARAVETTTPMIQGADTAKPPQRIVQELVLALRDDASVPFSVQAGGAKPIRMARGGKLQVPIAVTRTAGFAGEVRLVPQVISPQVRTQEIVLAPAEAAKTLDVDVDPAAPTGSFSFVLNGSHAMQYTRSAEVAAQADADAKRIAGVLEQARAAMQQSVQTRQQAEQTLQKATAMATATENQRVQAQQQKAQADERVQQATTAANEAKAAVEAATVAVNAATDAAAAQAELAQAQAKLTAAVKQLEDMTAQATAAAEKLTTAEKAKTEAGEAAKAAQTARDEAVAAAEKAQQDVQQADVAKRAADEKLRVTQTLAQPREVRAPVSSSPAIIEIVPSPWTATLSPAMPTIKAGGEPVALTAAVTREFDFAGEIKFELTPPQGVQGVGFADKANIVPAAQNQGELAITAAPAATPGTHTFILRGRYNFNARDLAFEQPIQITITPPDPPKQ